MQLSLWPEFSTREVQKILSPSPAAFSPDKLSRIAYFRGVILDDEFFMRAALREAEAALAIDEVPVGAVIVANGKIIARGHNQVEKLNDVTAHAEMIAFTAAANSLGGKYLNDCILYVTLEPCLMCAGASAWARISRIVFGAWDPKKGYSTYLNEKTALHPSTEVKGGVLSGECSEIISAYFRSKR